MNVMPKAPTPPSPLCGVPKDCSSALGSYMVVTQLQVREIHPFLEEWGAQETSSIQRTVKISGAATASPEVDLRALQFAESLRDPET